MDSISAQPGGIKRFHEFSGFLVGHLPEADEEVVHAGHFEGALQAEYAFGAFDVAQAGLAGR